MRKVWFAIAVTAAGCPAGAEDGDAKDTTAMRSAVGPGTGAGGLGKPDEEPNSRYVLGAVLDAPPYTTAEAATYFNVGVTASRRGLAQAVRFTGAASLTSTGADGVFAGTDGRLGGLTFTEGDVRLTVGVVGGDDNVTRYSLDARHGDGPSERLCDDAVVLLGVIDKTGRHTATPARLTFACSDGSAQECTAWGYAAGARDSPLWGVHQACLQMVNANYCADGAPSTRVGTHIQFLDAVGSPIAAGAQLPTLALEDWPPGPDEFYFEAAFSGAHAPAVCLGKLRWPTLATGCVASVPECPSGSIDGLVDPEGPHGAVLLVASRYNQLRLDRWSKRVDGTVVDHVATVRGYDNGAEQTGKAPWPGYAFEGRDGVLLRVPPDGVDPGALLRVAVFRRVAGDDRFVARADDARFVGSSAFVSEGFEGFVFAAPAEGGTRVPLYLYRRAETGERLATTMDAVRAGALGYALEPDAQGTAMIGWITAAE